MPYPPGMSRRDFIRAGIDGPETEDCEECGGVYKDDGHEIGCPNEGWNMADFEEAERGAAAEARFDAMREDGRL